MKQGKFITLGIETSCDETSVAVVSGGREIMSNVVSSQIDIHAKFGGVVPEIASRRHLQDINEVLELALKEAGTELCEVDLIGVTNGPGLIGALVIGVATAKALSFATGIPLVGVNHMHGHIAAAYLQYKDLEPPFLTLLVSGGHTNLVHVTDYNRCEMVGETRDDAVGEAYDKVAVVMGLGYPGGPKIDACAKSGNSGAIDFKRVRLEKGSLDFSFSGLKTQVLNYLGRERMRGNPVNREDVCASFQQAAIDVLVEKTIAAAEKCGVSKVTASGGVAANSLLRKMLKKGCDSKGIKLYLPGPALCTDNAAMIGAAAYYGYRMNGADDLLLDAHANLPF